MRILEDFKTDCAMKPFTLTDKFSVQFLIKSQTQTLDVGILGQLSGTKVCEKLI